MPRCPAAGRIRPRTLPRSCCCAPLARCYLSWTRTFRECRCMETFICICTRACALQFSPPAEIFAVLLSHVMTRPCGNEAAVVPGYDWQCDLSLPGGIAFEFFCPSWPDAHRHRLLDQARTSFDAWQEIESSQSLAVQQHLFAERRVSCASSMRSARRSGRPASSRGVPVVPRYVHHCRKDHLATCTCWPALAG